MRCNDERKCFAKKKDLNGNISCGILTTTYPPNKCPFCKARAEETKGEFYPFDPGYGKGPGYDH